MSSHTPNTVSAENVHLNVGNGYSSVMKLEVPFLFFVISMSFSFLIRSTHFCNLRKYTNLATWTTAKVPLRTWIILLSRVHCPAYPRGRLGGASSALLTALAAWITAAHRGPAVRKAQSGRWRQLPRALSDAFRCLDREPQSTLRTGNSNSRGAGTNQKAGGGKRQLGAISVSLLASEFGLRPKWRGRERQRLVF